MNGGLLLLSPSCSQLIWHRRSMGLSYRGLGLRSPVGQFIPIKLAALSSASKHTQYVKGSPARSLWAIIEYHLSRCSLAVDCGSPWTTVADKLALEVISKTRDHDRTDVMNTENDVGIDRPQRQDIQPSHLGFPVVGIGASAGGFQAVQHFFEHMPADSGMAFVVVMYLSPITKAAREY